jgi:hypothetical protein
MKKIAKFGIAALLLTTLVASVFAFGGGGLGNEAAKQALKTGDYAAWKGAITAGLTQDRFNQMRDRYTAREQKRAEMEAAMDQGYEAWKALMDESPRGHMADIITEDNFDTYVAMYKARQNGDLEKAQELAGELGLENKGGCIGRFKGMAG